MPYSVCGCVPDVDQIPSSNPIKRLSKFLSKKKESDSEPPTLPQLVNSRPDLVSTEEEDADASHPSEHNMEIGDPRGVRSQSLLRVREKSSTKTFKNAKSACGDPKTYNPWTALQVDRNENKIKSGRHKEAFTDHNVAMMYYPYWGVSMFPAVGCVNLTIGKQYVMIERC